PYDRAADFSEGDLDELTHRMRLAGRQHKIVGFVMLQYAPHSFHVVAGMAPVALGVQIAEIESFLQAQFDGGNGSRDLAGNKSLSPRRALVVEEDAVGTEYAIGFAIVHGDPIGIEFGGRIGRAGIKRRRLALRHLPYLAV